MMSAILSTNACIHRFFFYLAGNLRTETVYRKINSWNPRHYLYQGGINHTRFRWWLSKSSPEVMDSCAPLVPGVGTGTKDPCPWSPTRSPSSKTGTKDDLEPGQKIKYVAVTYIGLQCNQGQIQRWGWRGSSLVYHRQTYGVPLSPSYNFFNKRAVMHWVLSDCIHAEGRLWETAGFRVICVPLDAGGQGLRSQIPFMQ